jgi:nucleoside phosphorylase
MLDNHLQERVSLVTALTSDRLIYSASEKRHLSQLYGADVVDMEGFAALEVLSRAGVAVAMLRVISDDCNYNLPNLSSALSPDGSLQSLPLAIGLIRQPIAAIRLIRGAIRGLQVLRKITTLLFSE